MKAQDCCSMLLFGLYSASCQLPVVNLSSLPLVRDFFLVKIGRILLGRIDSNYIANDTTPSSFLLDFNFRQFFAAICLLVMIFRCILLSPLFSLSASAVLDLHAVAV